MFLYELHEDYHLRQEKMFKVPTYDELEKKEKEFNNERKGYTSNLFLKRKLTDSNDSIEGLIYSPILFDVIV